MTVDKSTIYNLGPSSNVYTTTLEDGSSYPEIITFQDARPKEFVSLLDQIRTKPWNEMVILDLGCGEGSSTVEIGKTGAKVIGIEGRPEVAARATELARLCNLNNVSFKVANVTDIRAWIECDAVFASGLIHHLHNPFELLDIIGQYCSNAVYFCTHNCPEIEEEIHSSFFKGKLFEFNTNTFNDKEFTSCWFDEGGQIEEIKGDSRRHPRAAIGNEHSYWPSIKGLSEKMHSIGFEFSEIIDSNKKRLRNRIFFSKSHAFTLEKKELEFSFNTSVLEKNIYSEMKFLIESQQPVYYISKSKSYQNPSLKYIIDNARINLIGAEFSNIRTIDTFKNLVSRGIKHFIIDADNYSDLLAMYRASTTVVGISYVFCSIAMAKFQIISGIEHPITGEKLDNIILNNNE